MGQHTAISWADHTFNPWIGCTKVSVGDRGACEHCYAEAEAKRRGWAKWGDHPRHRTAESTWAQPLAWNRKAEREGTRPFVFCASLADVFDNQVPVEWRRDLFRLIRATPHLIWLLLTKRPQNIVRLFEEACSLEGRDPARHGAIATWWPDNAAIGLSVVTQDEADRDLRHLLQAKLDLGPAFAFLSMEPLMGAVMLGAALHRPHEPHVDWVITGGESGPGSRPSHPQWFVSLRDQCASAGVPFHFKRWGDWRWAPERAHFKGFMEEPWSRVDSRLPGVRPAFVVREGKNVAGRLLDGVAHDARPAVRP